MATKTSIKTTPARISISLNLEELAQSIWQMPKRDRQALEDILEEKFVKTVLRRSKQIPRLRREKKLLSLADLQKEFL